MDGREAEYLRQCIRELERAVRRWKVITFALLVLLTILIIPGSVVVLGFASTQRLQAERARLEAEQARWQAEEAARQSRTNPGSRPAADGTQPPPAGKPRQRPGAEGAPRAEQDALPPGGRAP